MGLEARIWAFWIRFGPRDWDSGLGTGIWASRLGGWTDGRRRRRKSPICVKAYVIDPFGAAAQKDRQTDRTQLLLIFFKRGSVVEDGE